MERARSFASGWRPAELKLREAIDRCLILVPAPLTIQWQDELLRFFGEPFQIIHSSNDQQQLLNLWEREAQVISSIDYAKQEDVRERVWQQRWDLIIVDEAHKCSAYTKRSAGRGDEVERTKRYQLAEQLSEHCDNLLLLTATPHHGDDDRFAHFIRLLDRDLFPEPHRVGADAKRVRREILRLGKDCPWSLRRLKEDLKDMHERRLFPDRQVGTVSFNLGPEEYAIYKAVTAYINEFLPQEKRKNSVALVRTVFQRRLASSTRAIHESLLRRRTKLTNLVEELEALAPAQRAKRLARLAGRLADTEQDEGDLDEDARDELVDGATAAVELGQLRAEIAALADVAARVGRVRDRVFDVVGEVLSLNNVNLPDMLREVAYGASAPRPQARSTGQADHQRVVQGAAARRHLLVVRRLGSVERPRTRLADGAEPGHVPGLRQEGSGGRALL